MYNILKNPTAYLKKRLYDYNPLEHIKFLVGYTTIGHDLESMMQYNCYQSKNMNLGEVSTGRLNGIKKPLKCFDLVMGFNLYESSDELSVIPVKLAILNV